MRSESTKFFGQPRLTNANVPLDFTGSTAGGFLEVNCIILLSADSITLRTYKVALYQSNNLFVSITPVNATSKKAHSIRIAI